MIAVNSSISINISIKTSWEQISEIQRSCAVLLKSSGIPEQISQSVLMCAVELAENAVKYSSETKGDGHIHLELAVEGSEIIIRVTNPINDEKSLSSFIRLINKIRKADNPSVLYLDRLKSLINFVRPGKSRLGLYRIVYEGGFNLGYSKENGLLTVSARRKF